MAETNFFWEPLSDNILQGRDEAGTVTAEYTTETGRYGNSISQNRAGTENQFHFDAQGSTLALTDDNQSVSNTRAYSAFGLTTESTADSELDFSYIGRSGYFDMSKVGTYVRHRSYDPCSGAWASRDPLGVWLGHTNPYAYVHNNPNILVDVNGMVDENIDVACSCSESLKSFMDSPPPEAVACIRTIRRCNVNVFCSPTCGPMGALGGLTFPFGGHAHICLPDMSLVSTRYYIALMLHECTHANQLIDADGRLCMRTPWPSTATVTVPERFPAGDICRNCKSRELNPYRIQAKILFPDAPVGTNTTIVAEIRKLREDFVAWGLCISCKHACAEYAAGCPSASLPPILLPPLPPPPSAEPIVVLPIDFELPAVSDIPFPVLR